MKYKEVVRRLEQDGWYWKRANGSHQIYKHPSKTGTVVVAQHGSKDLPNPIVKSILKQAGLE